MYFVKWMKSKGKFIKIYVFSKFLYNIERCVLKWMCLSLKGKKNELAPLDWLFFIKKGLIFWVCLFFAVFELMKLYVDYD